MFLLSEAWIYTPMLWGNVLFSDTDTELRQSCSNSRVIYLAEGCEVNYFIQ